MVVEQWDKKSGGVCQTRERQTIYRYSHPFGSLSLSAQPRSIQERTVNQSSDHQTPKVKPDASNSVDPPRSTKIAIATKAKSRKEGSFVKKMLPSGFSADRSDRRRTNNGNGNFGGLYHSTRQLFSMLLGGIRRVESMELRGGSTVFYAHMHTSRNQNTLLHPILARDVIVSPYD